MNRNEAILHDETGNLDVRALVRVLWQSKFLILGVSFVCGAIGVYIALTATPIFRAEVLVTQVHDAGMGGGGSSLASQLGGLASLAGVSLGSFGTGGAGQDADAMLHSRRLVEEFIKRNDLLPALYPQAKRPPTLWQAVKYFRENVINIQKDKLSDVTTVAVEWTDPAVAARWANGFVALVNEFLRARALQDAERNIAYLNTQIPKTTVVDVQRVMYDLIESQTKMLMLANARTEYAFTTIDPAVAPEGRVSPKRTLIVLTALFLGGLLGVIIALARHAWRPVRPMPS